MGVIKPISNKLVVESAIKDYQSRVASIDGENQRRNAEARKIMKEQELHALAAGKVYANQKRYTSFSESLSAVLLGEALYHIMEHSVSEELLNKEGSKTIMRVMVSDFVTEDAPLILRRMGHSAILSDIHEAVTSTKKKILESIDKNDPASYTIAPDVKDEFFDKLDDMETDSITDAIRERVSGEVNDFIDANRQDHEQILSILQMTKDKLEEKEKAPDAVKESYTNMSRRAIAKVRTRKKSVFESMVSAMCEGVMKHDELKEEFMEGSQLDVGKIVDRIQLMYTFLETVNSLKLYPIDESYITDLIESLRK